MSNAVPVRRSIRRSPHEHGQNPLGEYGDYDLSRAGLWVSAVVHGHLLIGSSVRWDAGRDAREGGVALDLWPGRADGCFTAAPLGTRGRGATTRVGRRGYGPGCLYARPLSHRKGLPSTCGLEAVDLSLTMRFSEETWPASGLPADGRACGRSPALG